MSAPETVLQDRYRIVRIIGKGGTGAVYEAVDLRLGNRVALKQTIIPAEQTINLLEREARLLARLRHPALPRIIDHFADGTYQYLVMEFIGGDDLGALLIQRDRPFELRRVLEWADQLLDALDYLHRQNPPVLHRDIKPQNLKLTADDNIVLLDFGLAKGGAGSQSIHRTNESIFGYTPHYAPLEQINGAGTEARSDLYSLAATLYHLLTGVQPPDALTRATAVLRRLPDPLIAPDLLNAAIPKEMSALLMQTLALNLDERPASAADMRASLATIRAGQHTADPERMVIYPADADTLSVAQAHEHYGAGNVQSLTPTTRPSDTQAAQHPTPSGALTQRTPATQRSASGGAGRSAVLWQRMRATGLRGWCALRSYADRLPSPWNRYALPASGVLALLIMFSVALVVGSGRPAPMASSSPEMHSAVSASTPVASPALHTLPITQVPVQIFAPDATTATSVQPIARRVTPDEVYAVTLPVTLTVEGEALDQARVFKLESSETGYLLPLEVSGGDSAHVTLLLTMLPSAFRGEATLTLTIDGVPQPQISVVVRDFLERRTVAGVRSEYRYTERIGVDELGAYTSLYVAPDAASDRFAVLRNDDVVEILRNDTAGWYQVRIQQSGNSFHLGAIGWIERWLIDNQRVPPLIFDGILGQTPTDRAVRCGTQFNSSIYGSVEDRRGQGVAGATLTVTSADGRNQFSVRTRANGTYTVSGLGCTTWIVRLTSVADFPEFQANEVRVTNLNGGRYTAAEVRFRQRP
jgi:serine/threonine protein kinase